MPNNTISQVEVNGTTYDLLDMNTLSAVSAIERRVTALEDSVDKITSASDTGWYAFKKSGVVVVGLEGNNLSFDGAGDTLFTLPVGFRPNHYVNFVFEGSTGMGNGMMMTDGRVRLWPNRGSTTHIRGQVVFHVTS